MVSEPKPPAAKTESCESWQQPRPRTVIASIVIALHIVGITLAPASVPPASQLSQNAWEWFSPYLQAAYLNHGYHYFAPNPGPSSLIEYTITKQDGTREWGRIPDRKKNWPRLLYHRHFMLTEFYGGLPPSADEMRQAVAQSYASQLLKEPGAVSVELTHVTHQLSTREEILEGAMLDAPDKYEHKPIGTYFLSAASDDIAPSPGSTAQK